MLDAASKILEEKGLEYKLAYQEKQKKGLINR